MTHQTTKIPTLQERFKRRFGARERSLLKLDDDDWGPFPGDIGGWTTINDERRFIPIGGLVPPGGTFGYKPHYCSKKGPCPSNLNWSFCKTCSFKIAHCKSCRYFRKAGNCVVDGIYRTAFTNPESEACLEYVNRNYSLR